MTPYYDDGQCVIYHGDCREVMPTLTADVVLTDPPYGLGLDYGDWEDSPELVDELARTTHPLMLSVAPVVALTPGIVNVYRWPAPRWILAWTWQHTGSTGGWGFNQWGPILVYGTDPYLTAGKGRQPDLIRCSANDFMQSGHPCAKPQSAWLRILTRVSPFGSSVVDPFMGSGTTLRVAKDLGRTAVGIEIEERYCEIAATRLAQGVLDFGATA